jgi:gamma-glutamyltranspeptidase/glutathione hydrolase
MAWVAEPFMASIGGGGFIAIRTPEGTVEVIDGNSAMPHTAPEAPGQGLNRIFAPDYSDGLWTCVGSGSIAVPGILAAVRLAWERHGSVEWRDLFAPAIGAAREGIEFPRTSAYYLSATWREIWRLFEPAVAQFAPDGEPLPEGATLKQEALADSLEAIAERGPTVFYSDEIAAAIGASIRPEGGFLTQSDLDRYEAIVRTPVSTNAFGWRIDSNPPPTVGGALLTHMLALLEETDVSDPLTRLNAIVEAQRAATGWRRERYQDPADIAGAMEDTAARLPEASRSADTTHASSADRDGYICSLTESCGYGSGIIVGGILLNNTLGEEELNPTGLHRFPPGTRCHSNMTPTIATGPDRTVGLGSPGAARIVGAIAQVLIRLAVDGDSLADAVAAPRAHLDTRAQGETLCFEPGLPGERLDFIHRPYDELHMYFGAVQAASVDREGRVDAAHDPRRSGAHRLV